MDPTHECKCYLSVFAVITPLFLGVSFAISCFQKTTYGVPKAPVLIALKVQIPVKR